ncbi:Protein prenyltransferase, alpha subunit [Trichormus variabilis ATCC 29413]|uniref:Protein prenyltransferase, alpha subunit n=2 Tax=Anabaena variabilis TaxID=264691 RepID=Q3M7C2_TRIV2|nr:MULTISPECIES: tetratricopeptide repeat protein [Nostocaceae]ABA23114.1 Protein prenyltransferase, alpha subunit [Trichormus variabilis ATCC 29413]MBC1214100.1 tetratricopeptide repeat protein [Trichormus variabilis ARAD]MBC1303361.1 tetratricopeptide repeat protein [Trichormus variabilis N2B]MBC1309857.1 tetratricopeptide repeat protein [Trichormus variabilis PNB]MBC1326790.1 tetratricopeptide repeat protein [Trichormus variabilis 9RC]
MLKQLWQWLKRSFGRLFGRKHSPVREQNKVEPPQRLTDAEYESLFLQLLAEVNDGLTRGEAKGFLAAKHINEGDLVEWLRGFGERLFASAKPNDELVSRMVRLGELSIGEVSDVAGDIGRRLGGGETNRRGAEDAEEEETSNQFNDAIELTSDEAEAWLNQGVALANLGQLEQAITSFDKAIEFKPDDDSAWYSRGVALCNLGRFEQAIASYNRAIEFKHNFPEAWTNRGVILNSLKLYQEALTSFETALQINPNFPEVFNAWYGRGNTLFNLEKFEEAIASYDKAIEFKADDYSAWYNRGVALDNLGQFEEAIASYDKAIEFKADDYSAWNYRGVALANLGRFEEAIASYDKAIEFKADDYSAWYNRGVALSNLGRFQEAITSYDKAIEFKADFYIAWMNRGIVAGNVIVERIDFSTFPLPHAAAHNLALKFNNPDLNKRGYEGRLASYEEGLKHCQQETHPEGWGKLHRAIGDSHYYQGRGNYNTRYFWRKAINSYKTALQTLTATNFPELHLEVLQDLIRVLLDLGEIAEATELQRQGTELLRRLLNEPNRSERSKKQLALKFAWIQQLTVDLAVQSGDLLQAIELAEEGKNTCLRWLLDGWSDEISSPNYSEIQQLLNPSTAIVYWHLSSYALHTFILKHNAPSPIVLGNTECLTQAQRLRDFEAWVKKWNEQYANYPKDKDKQGEKDRTWRDNLPEMLRNLSHILDINAVVSTIPDITQLILIPHRDLHRFPLHALFPPEFTISYLPSAKIGSISVKKDNYNQKNLLSIEHPNSTGYPSLDFAEIESEAISQMFANPTRLHSEQATQKALINALPQSYNIFHFTGHGVYNFQNPALSFLALADEDKLTLADIHGFKLQSYQLVTLAACETAITGNHTITTEYVGLVSGFMGCGVAHVVSTLWTVESAASALVMIQFYQLLQQGKPETIALAEATQWLRNVTNAELAQWYAAQLAKVPENQGLLYNCWSRHLNKLKNNPEPSKQPYNHPYFWAAFTITGNFSQ